MKTVLKKAVSVLLILVLLIPLLNFAGAADSQIRVTIDGKTISFDVPPQIINNRTMVPMRAIFEALGADVYWNGTEKTISAVFGSDTMKMTIGDRRLSVNGVMAMMDVAPIIFQGRTLVPARFIAEAFGCLVDWLAQEKTVRITTTPQQTTAGSGPRHAPNMYVDWSTDGTYDSISVDWYCSQDAENTYWAVHNWDNGYAGFQNRDGRHVLLLSLWDLDNGVRPTVEYVWGGKNGDFGGEGTGKQVFSDYAWKTGTWYSMRIDLTESSGKTYYTQWIREGSGDWLKTASISYPGSGFSFSGDSVFQEDFTFNDLMRGCRVKNACGKRASSGQWQSWTRATVSNSYFPTDDATWENGVRRNILFDCRFGANDEYVWVQSGGEGFAEQQGTLPAVYTLRQNDTPTVKASNSLIADGVYVIATMLNTDYVLDIDGAGVSNGDNLQLWERNGTPAQTFRVTHLGDDNYRIVNTNSGKAIDAEWGGTTPETNVWQYDVNDTPAQTWKAVACGNGSFYLINQKSGLYLDVNNANAASGTNIKLFPRNDAYDAQKWFFFKQ